MKQLVFSLYFFFLSALLFAAPVNPGDAGRVGLAYLKANTSLILPGNQPIQVYQSAESDYINGTTAGAVNYFYVFDISDKAFVIVAADDRVFPILGYSTEGTFDPGNIAPAVAKWLDDYSAQIRYVIDNDIAATPEITAEWEKYALATSTGNPILNRGVSPLLQTKWNQSPYYNAQCPGGSVTGCVATAMAQVMKYWNHPATGSGFHSYNHQNYGTISANFGNTTYNWSSMPNVVNGSNSAVATLNFHCGVSVDMQYSPEVSGAFVIQNSPTPQACSEYAFKTYFGYKTSLQGVERENYNQTQWTNLLKAELDASRPILYAGFGSGGGHAFVCDGYDNSGYFHFNWGWGGAYDGFFSINALNPDGVGTGGGTGGFNSGHQAIIGIEPVGGGNNGGGGGGNEPQQDYDLSLYAGLSTSANTIYYGQAFSVSTNIANLGESAFSGDYCAAAFDSQSNFVDYVDILSGYSLQSGYAYSSNLVFSSTGSLSMLPGIYAIAVFYRPTGGNWIAVPGGNYNNIAQITVINPNAIEVASDITVQGGNTLTQGQPVSVNFNMYNDGYSTFYGQYGVGLFNLDGSLAQTIDLYTENTGLPVGYAYLAPYLTVSNSSVSVSPGTYFLAVQHKPNNQNWQLTGSSYFQNPIYVTVQAPSLSPDVYENNNSMNSAYSLPVNFSGNSANPKTTGSNLHTGTDIDYYKISLPSGYNYTLTARIHDSYSSGNGISYTVDGIVSYSTNSGSEWSSAYDDIIPGTISVPGGGTVYFVVAPYFSGETGGYLLDISVQRSTQTGTEELSRENDLLIYPNPAGQLVNVSSPSAIRSIDFINSYGQVLSAQAQLRSDKLWSIETASLAAGVYHLRIKTEEGIITKKLIVQP